MRLYNTATKQIEDFKPLNPPNVALYSCGPTVYDYTHIGHLRAYVNVDLLKRSLVYLDGFKVNHVMNITDVGHLTGDDDTGEDKLEKGAKKKGLDIWDLVKIYTDYFFSSLSALNIKKPNNFYTATGHIKEEINLIEKLFEDGFAYETDEAVYFNTANFKNYGALSGQKLNEKILGARENVHVDTKKKNPADFVLWFKAVGRFKNHIMRWPSPWGDGFPGWHIECSAISMKYLGETIDIHAGGVDHISVHHENEKAQSEAATGKPFVKYWFHSEFLMVDGRKMSKSLGNFYTIGDVKNKGFDPMALRLLYLQTHYRQTMNFTWDALEAADTAYKRLKNHILELKEKTGNKKADIVASKYKQEFRDELLNDLQTPKAVAILWEVVKADIEPDEKLALILNFDEILGLGLDEADVVKADIPEEIIKLTKEREVAREEKNFAKSDELRQKINEKGYEIKDTEEGYKITKR
ncbi:MAG: Cysteine-tRNA ligase [Parcubacteria group bacterium GW2011_GWC2_40_31]|nr:MAG: Cysteine-tRNA ligase [Parcubacteria group bacterium GW2011_GWF2_40_10]KKR47339.1 MAG: Cysteine-tRNA ligase [Parcubacteria group bacterium GW2011_GWA2_40_143]KKR59981.1 MAG: Cysteine-tRNA ligase [Parcubacteria group bacterium GW2011_GWC2_40_31]KKR83082.1 MAG: Cysteine-tRNA ligase [Parcubacteria group bacterium GW2011_GWD2_40_9]